MCLQQKTSYSYSTYPLEIKSSILVKIMMLKKVKYIKNESKHIPDLIITPILFFTVFKYICCW